MGADSPCFVYVRYWPGFTDKFPYERFNMLPENEIGKAVREAVVKERWRRRAEIRMMLAKQKLERAEAARRRREFVATQTIQRPDMAGDWNPSTLSYRTEPRPYRSVSRQVTPESAEKNAAPRRRKTYEERIAHSACLVGWHESSGPVRGPDGDDLFSRLVWIADVSSPEIAESLIDEIRNYAALDRIRRERASIINPRFGYTSLVSQERRASARSACEWVRTSTGGKWAEFDVRSHFNDVDRFLRALQVESDQQIVPTAPSASVGEKETGDGVAPKLDRTISSVSDIGSDEVTTAIPSAGHEIIPADKQTRPLTYKQVAKLLGHIVENASRKIKQLIDLGPTNGGIHRPLGTGREKKYHIDDFPPQTHEVLRPKPRRGVVTDAG